MRLRYRPVKRDAALGFTIVELTVVIVAISVLVSITYMGYSSYRADAKSQQYKVDATAILSKAKTMAAESSSLAGYPTSANSFPTDSNSSHTLPAGVGVTFTSAAANTITNTEDTATNPPNLSSSTTSALTISTSPSKRTYAVISCRSSAATGSVPGVGIKVFYPDAVNNTPANSAVKVLTAGDTTTNCS